MKKELIRCPWPGEDPLYQKYHDEEWAKQVKDDQTLFEFLILEGAQAGLSWITVLRKREGYRSAFADFKVEKVAAFEAADIERLMLDEGIVRNRLKIKSCINNAKLFIAIQKEYGSFYTYLWSFMPGKNTIINEVYDLKAVPVRTEISDAISKDMKKRGFKFFGSTICYAFMQAVGMVDDHIQDCFCKAKN